MLAANHFEEATSSRKSTRNIVELLQNAERPPIPVERLRGTLDLLILQTLLAGPTHGHAIAKHIQRTSEDLLQVETGSLYPALYRLEAKGWITASWELSDKGKLLGSIASHARGANSSPANNRSGRRSPNAHDNGGDRKSEMISSPDVTPCD